MNKLKEHPGKIIQKKLQEFGFTQKSLAYAINKNEAFINSIIHGKCGISPELSQLLGLFFNVDSNYFFDLQKKFENHFIKKPSEIMINRINIAKQYPIQEMIRRGWIEDGDPIEELKKFFKTDKIDSEHDIKYVAKKSGDTTEDYCKKQKIWLQRVTDIAKSLVCRSVYSKNKLKDSLKEVKKLLSCPENIRYIPRILDECGVRFLIVEPIKKLKIDGVCFWIDQNSPVIALSTRYDRIDNFWFVLLHKIDHILNNDGMNNPIFLDTDNEKNIEIKADNFASKFILEEDKISSFIKRKHPIYTPKDIMTFAKMNEIHPGILVGRIHHITSNYKIFRNYLVKVRKILLEVAVYDGWGYQLEIIG